MSAEKFEFQAEVKQLLDLMIHSLYSNRDVFLRELISNASDACDRLRFEGLTDASLLPDEPFAVNIEVDPKTRVLSVSDNGIGMSRDEVVQNIGTIAKSGTAEFLRGLSKSGESKIPPELIGQFGVGFYASFMVAEEVSVLTRKAGEAKATRWSSSGDGSYAIEEALRDHAGTTIRLRLKVAEGDDSLADYTNEWVLRKIVKRYSDFVAYPIHLKIVGADPLAPERLYQKLFALTSQRLAHEKRWAREALIRIAAAVDLACFVREPSLVMKELADQPIVSLL